MPVPSEELDVQKETDELIQELDCRTSVEILKNLSTSNVFTHAKWVSLEWAEEHFGSRTEAKFVAAAKPKTVFGLLKQIDDLTEEIKLLKRKVLIAREIKIVKR